MPTEIERKYLIANDNWKTYADEGKHMIQGYMASNEHSSIRIRVNNDNANLNIKSNTIGIQRSEYDYPIPLDEAMELLNTLCDQPLIEKTRYHVNHEGHLWEIDVFAGDNEGLVVAEIELASADDEFILPDWIGQEVSDDPRYYNVCLAKHPYKDW